MTLRIDSATGELCVDAATGTLCLCDPSVPGLCQFCQSGTTPTNYNVTVSGVGNDNLVSPSSVSINQNKILPTAFGSTCQWQTNESVGFDVKFWQVRFTNQNTLFPGTPDEITLPVGVKLLGSIIASTFFTVNEAYAGWYELINPNPSTIVDCKTHLTLPFTFSDFAGEFGDWDAAGATFEIKAIT